MAATARAVDLTNAKEGGNFRPKRKPSGDYRAKIVKADDHQPNDKTKPMGWVLTIQVEGDARASYPYYLSPAANQAWKVGGICRAAGLNVKTAKVRFDPNKLVGKAIGVALEDDEYEGKPKSVIDDVFPVSEVGANADEDVPEDDEVDLDDVDEEEPIEEEEEPEPPAKPVRRRKPAPDPEPEEDEEEEEPEPDPAPKPRRRRAAPPPPVEEDDEDEDEEEPEPTPPPRRRAKKATPPPPPADDEDEDLDLDDLDE